MTASVSPSPLVVGGTAVYTVTVRNTGNASATNLTTTLPFTPSNTLAIGSPLPVGCTSSGQTVTCTGPTIAAGATVSYQIPVTVLPGISNGTNIALRALATATGVPAAGTDLITQAFTKVDVEIGKTGPTAVGPGGTIDYTITVTNHGPSNAASVTWHDPTDGNLITITSYPCGNTGLTVSCSPGTLAPGETRTFHITATVNPSVPAGTVIHNCAVVYTGTSPETNPDNNQSCMDTTVGTSTPPVSDIEIVKSAPATVQKGGTVSYTVTVTNRGPDPATNVIVSDPVNVPFDSISSLPPGCTQQDNTVACQAGTLAVGEKRTVSFSVKLASTVAAGTNIMNCAAVTSKNNEVVQDPNPSCVQTLVVPVRVAQVGIAKTGPATTHPGDTISYTLTVTNTGPDAAANVVVTDPTSPSLVTIASAPGGCTVVAGSVTCDIGTLAAGDTRVLTITARVNDGVAAETVIKNCGSVTSVTANPDSAGTESCINTTVNPVAPVADVEVAKSGPATAPAGGVIQYSVTVTNHGPDDATGVVVQDPLDRALVTAASLPSDCALTGDTVICQAGTLTVDATKTFTFTVSAAAGLAVGTQIQDCAAATSNSTVLTPVPRVACIQTTVVPSPAADVSITKTGPASVSPGGTISYVLTVADNGPDAAANVVVTDPFDLSLVTVTSLPAGCTQAEGTVHCVAGTLAVGGSKAFTIDVQVNPGIQGVVIPNCAPASSDTSDPNLNNNQSCMNTIVDLPRPPSAILKVAKDAPATLPAGGTARYSVTVTNNGPDAAANVVVTDSVDQSLVTVTSLPAGLPADCVLDGATITCLAGTLAVGESKTFTYTVSVAAGAQPGTVIDNCAAATSNFARTIARSSPACTQTVVVPPAVAQLRITKTAPQKVLPGGAISYSLSATNLGPDAAKHVFIADLVDLSLVTITSLPSGCALGARTLICTLGTLAAGETRHLTIEARARADVRPPRVIGNCAAIYTTTHNLDLRRAQSCVTTIVRRPSAGVVVVKQGPATVRTGAPIGYPVRVTNRGPDTASNIVIRDPVSRYLAVVTPLPRDCSLAGNVISCHAGSLLAGQSRTFRFTVRVRPGVRAGARIRNCATASSDRTTLKPAGRRSCTLARVAATPFVPVTG